MDEETNQQPDKTKTVNGFLRRLRFWQGESKPVGSARALGRQINFSRRNLSVFALVFVALVGIGLYLSFAASGPTNEDLSSGPTTPNGYTFACIDNTGDAPTHEFIHVGSCSQAEKSEGWTNSSTFAWCADLSGSLSPAENNWLNDGGCPPPGGGITVNISADPNTIVQGADCTKKNPSQCSLIKWSVDGSVDHCEKVMAPNSQNTDPYWSGNAPVTGSYQAYPQTTGLYIYVFRCFDANGNNIGHSSTTLQVNANGGGGGGGGGGSTNKTYTGLACIDPTGGNVGPLRFFAHSANCTHDEHNSLGLKNFDNYTWCASSSDQNSWVNDGVCPGDKAPVAVPITIPPGDNLNKVHAVYALPADYVKMNLYRNFDVNGRINNSLAADQSWLKQQTGGKTFKYDISPATGKAQVDVVILKEKLADLLKTSYDTAFYSIINDIQTQIPTQGNRIYAVYVEGDVKDACGVGGGGSRFAMAFIRNLDDGCPASLTYTPSQVQLGDLIELHEIVHALGFIQPCAPHDSKKQDGGGHVTDNVKDLMFWGGAGGWTTPVSQIVLDYGHNDYLKVPSNNPCYGSGDMINSPYLY